MGHDDQWRIRNYRGIIIPLTPLGGMLRGRVAMIACMHACELADLLTYASRYSFVRSCSSALIELDVSEALSGQVVRTDVDEQSVAGGGEAVQSAASVSVGGGGGGTTT